MTATTMPPALELELRVLGACITNSSACIPLMLTAADREPLFEQAVLQRFWTAIEQTYKPGWPASPLSVLQSLIDHEALEALFETDNRDAAKRQFAEFWSLLWNIGADIEFRERRVVVQNWLRRAQP